MPRIYHIWDSKKRCRKVKKSVDNSGIEVLYYQSPRGTWLKKSYDFKNFFKKMKKVLDKIKTQCYINQADADEAVARMYLEN